MSEPSIHISSILDELTLHDFQVGGHVSGDFVACVLESQPALPGVVIKEQGCLKGMISRRRFLEALSRAYGRELFLRRALTVMQGFIPQDFLVVSRATLVTEAAVQVIQRPIEILNEPLVVEGPPGSFRLLDIHDLLIAQSQIHQLTSRLLQEKTRAEMMHTEKLASLGKLLAGVAHEVRNPVNFIAGNLHHLEAYGRDLQQVIEAYQAEQPESGVGIQALLEQVDLEFVLQDFPRILNSMASGTNRLKDLVNSLRMFSRLDEREWCQMDIHQSIDGTLLILNNRIKTGIQVVKNYGELPAIKGYPSQIDQVFMNLITNAIDALIACDAVGAGVGEKGLEKSCISNTGPVSTCFWKPEITITTQVVSQLPTAVKRASSHRGDWISICIRDNGPGIPADIQQRVFEDFFTTKSADEGTGLGLPITVQIIQERHQGHLVLKSPCLPSDGLPERGTQFEVLLPVVA